MTVIVCATEAIKKNFYYYKSKKTLCIQECKFIFFAREVALKKNVWMLRSNRFKSCFFCDQDISQVGHYLPKTNLPDETMLLLDNTPVNEIKRWQNTM